MEINEESSNEINQSYYQNTYRCSHCGKKLSSARSLNIHEKIHTGQKNYICQVEGCGKSFYIKSMLIRHQFVHSNNREERCPYKKCTSRVKLFKTKADVKQHIKNWHSIEKIEGREIRLLKRISILQKQLESLHDLQNNVFFINLYRIDN